jgi:rhodanese-related sulfurtransferase
MSEPSAFPSLSSDAVRDALRARREIALIDAREEDVFAQAHPLFAAQLPMSRVERDAPWRLPRRDVTVVIYDDGEGLADRLARRLVALGYAQVHRLAGDLDGWRRSGGELFRDVNAPSKAFGELVEHKLGTPSLSADEVKALIDARADVVVLDARRLDEFRTMSIPTGVSVPGAELVLRVRALAPDPSTRVIVNCAGRTRSIIGAQSLVNAGIPNPVAALRNGTIGWKLAGLDLAHGQDRRFAADAGRAPADAHDEARAAARMLADRSGALRLSREAIAAFDDRRRTVYRYDVRSPEEYAAGHLPGFRSAPGGQLVQETDVFAPVRGARIVLADDDGVRAPMTAHWLAQMGWEVAWIDGLSAEDFIETGSMPPPAPRQGVATVAPAALDPQHDVVVDVSTSADFVRRHVAGAWWVLRSQCDRALEHIERARGRPMRWIVTADREDEARWVAVDLQAATSIDVRVLEGGNAAWFAAGLPVESGEDRLASPRIDRYRRPYEGTDNPREAMQAYLDWEYGLVDQLARDGTHGFRVMASGDDFRVDELASRSARG